MVKWDKVKVKRGARGAVTACLVFSQIVLGGCSLLSPKPLDEQSVKAQIEQHFNPKRADSTVTVQEIKNRKKTDGKTDIIEFRVLLDEKTALRSLDDPLDEPALHVESIHQAEFAYEDKQWQLKGLAKIQDVAVSPKEGVNAMVLTNPVGRDYVEGAPKARFWRTKLVEHKTDLEKGTDMILLRKESKNSMIEESGTVKYAYTFNKATGKWDQTEESKMDDWRRVYHIAGDWQYKFTTKDGYYETISLRISEVDPGGKISIHMDSKTQTYRILSGIQTKTTWTAGGGRNPQIKV